MKVQKGIVYGAPKTTCIIVSSMQVKGTRGDRRTRVSKENEDEKEEAEAETLGIEKNGRLVKNTRKYIREDDVA